jgi:hypothetical protein
MNKPFANGCLFAKDVMPLTKRIRQRISILPNTANDAGALPRA